MKFSNYICFLLVFLVLGSVVYSFSVEDYITPGEDKNSITYTNFTFANSTYSLVKIASKEALLLRDGELLKNESEIKTALRYYYKLNFYPGSSELNSITGYLDVYNNSRNDGGKFKGKEENVCDSMLLLDGKIIKNPDGSPVYCDSQVNCTKIIQIFYFSAPYTEGIRQTISYQDAYKYVKQFADASYGNDRLIGNSFNLLQNLNVDNLNSSLNAVKSVIPALKTNKQVIESSLFRTPRDKDTADLKQCRKENCFGFCPDFSFNGTALDNLDSSLQSVMTKAAPILNLNSISSAIAKDTERRLLFRTNEKKSDYYDSVFQPLLFKVTPTILDGDATLARINNPGLRTKVARLKELNSIINRSIATRNFSTIDSYLSELDKLNKDTQQSIPLVIELYNSTLTSKNTADAEIFVLDSKDLESSDKEKFDKLKSITITLDNSFSNGLSDEQYVSFSDAYKGVADEGATLLKNSRENPVSTVNLKFRALARRINNALSDILSSLGIGSSITASQNNKTLVIGGFSALTFLSLAAITLLVALSAYLSGTMKKTGFIVLIVVLLGALLANFIFSSTLYVYLDKTSADADVEEFLIDFASRHSVSTVIDMGGAPDSAVVSMSKCAVSLSDRLHDFNRTTVTYNILGDGCTVTTASGTVAKTKADCELAYTNSSIINMKYSSTLVKPKFNSVYESRVYLAGDEDFYKSCHIKSIFN